MMNDEQLTLYYYGDGLSSRERREVEKALEANDVLAARYRQLSRELESMRQIETEPPARPAVQRWHDAVSRAARIEQPEPGDRGFHWNSFAVGAAASAALVLLAALVLVPGLNSPGDPPVGPGLASSAAPPSAFARGLTAHLRDSRVQLASLVDNGDRVGLVLQIIEQNRLYRRAAEQNGSYRLARVLRAFEPVLVELAAEDLGDDAQASLRSQLAFEMNVVLTKLASQTSEQESETSDQI